MTTDVITEEVIRARIDGIMREMQAAVMRTGFSTIIRECNNAVPINHGIKDAFSTGSQNQNPPQPNS